MTNNTQSDHTLPAGEDLKRQIEAALGTIQAIAETIRDLGEVPSGVLYARLMGTLPLHDYNRVIDILKRSGLVTETPGHLLRWSGPKAARRAQ